MSYSLFPLFLNTHFFPLAQCLIFDVSAERTKIKASQRALGRTISDLLGSKELFSEFWVQIRIWPSQLGFFTLKTIFNDTVKKNDLDFFKMNFLWTNNARNWVLHHFKTSSCFFLYNIPVYSGVVSEAKIQLGSDGVTAPGPIWVTNASNWFTSWISERMTHWISWI